MHLYTIIERLIFMQNKLTLSQLKHIDIINAAKKEFIDYGFVAANMQSITAAAGVSKRTLYRHFESKSVLFESVLIAINDSIKINNMYQFDDSKSTELQLQQITYQEIEVIYSIYGMSLARTILIEFMRQPEMAKNYINNIHNNCAITQWFNQAIEAGRLKSGDTKLMTDVYISLFQGLLFWPQVMNSSVEFNDAEIKTKVDTVTGVFIESYGLK